MSRMFCLAARSLVRRSSGRLGSLIRSCSHATPDSSFFPIKIRVKLSGIFLPGAFRGTKENGATALSHSNFLEMGRGGCILTNEGHEVTTKLFLDQRVGEGPIMRLERLLG